MFEASAEAWIHVGGAHYKVMTYVVTNNLFIHRVYLPTAACNAAVLRIFP
nr:hypothetical protein [Paenibacillus sp. cl130]